MTPEQLAEGLNAATRVSAARMELTERPDGVTIINDAFNANPDSTRAALKALVAIGRSRGARTWAVLGEMLELGDDAAAGHERVGTAAAAVVDRLIVVGGGAAGIARGARDAGLAADALVEAPDRPAALAALDGDARDGDVILVKASRGVELDLLVDDLAAALEARAGGAS
jgi:UDP-N-acetylmuramoyl-tripeptide--D-alanyl-D-alanine ligase